MVKSYLDPTCDPELWTDMPPGEKLLCELKASTSPNYFWAHPAMGNFSLWESKQSILDEFYQYDKNARRIYSELLFFAGMKGGKSMTATVISLTEVYKLLMMKNPQEFYELSPNSEIMCVNIARAEHQALDTVFAKAKEIVSNSPYFMAQKADLTYNKIKFPKSITLKALGSDLGSGLGRSLKCFVADEIDSYDDPNKTYQKLRKQTGLFKKWNENIRVAITSRGETSYLPNLQAKAKKAGFPWVLSIAKATWELNPTMTLDVLKDDQEFDPDSFEMDYGIEPVEDIEALFNRSKLELAVKRCENIHSLFIGQPNLLTRNEFTPVIDTSRLIPAPDAFEYIVAVDPSIKHDAFGLSVGYLSTNQEAKVIGSTVFRSKKNEEINTAEIKKILKSIFEALPVRYYIYDVYLHSELRDLATGYGIIPLFNQLTLNDWIFTRNDLYNGILTVPYSDYLWKEFKELLIIRNKKVNHPPQGSKDQADTVAQLNSFIRRQQEEARLNSGAAVTHHIETF